MKKKYMALRTVGTVYKVVGIIIGIITIIGAIGICITSFAGGAAMGALGDQLGRGSAAAGFLGSALGGVMIAVVTLLYGALGAVTLYGMGELVYLLIDLEENTRTTAEMVASRSTHAVSEDIPKV